jgi:septal ring factor EnvC (AmiA/AmiB activator)
MTIEDELLGWVGNAANWHMDDNGFKPALIQLLKNAAQDLSALRSQCRTSETEKSRLQRTLTAMSNSHDSLRLALNDAVEANCELSAIVRGI